MSDPDLNALRTELDDFAIPARGGARSSFDERLIAGFEEIQGFIAIHGRSPQHGEDRDIFERLYAVRLERLRVSKEFRDLLVSFDRYGVLTPSEAAADDLVDTMDSDDIFAELVGVAGSPDITELRHVRSSAEKRASEEIAERQRCKDFEKFKPLFDVVRNQLKSGVRTARPFVKASGFLKADIKVGQFFIIGGQTAYVAEIGEAIKAPNGEFDARLRVIYSNETESDLLLRSLQRALYKDEAGRRITEPEAGPLFSDETADGDEESGTVYVLRSRSEHPTVATNREILHKIGVTGGSVKRRIANTRLDPTFLMADVEVVATYELYNINRSKLESLIHRIFAHVRADIEVKDRFGIPIIPREWFFVPIFIIDDVIEKIKTGTITDYEYDKQSASMVKRAD